MSTKQQLDRLDKLPQKKNQKNIKIFKIRKVHAPSKNDDIYYHRLSSEFMISDAESNLITTVGLKK